MHASAISTPLRSPHLSCQQPARGLRIPLASTRQFGRPAAELARSSRTPPSRRHPSGRDVTVSAASPGRIRREVLTSSERTKLDGDDDRFFYESPRIVKHVDDAFLGQVTRLYRQRIPEGGVVLDLMSSWVSHLPDDVQYERVIGHGMNAQELSRNPRLESFFVRDLNSGPSGWSLADQSVDAVICCVSVQYLQKPEEVFAEIFRVLKPGGVCIMSFSNRTFYSKAISAWRDGTGYSRSQLVNQYYMAIEGFTKPEIITEVPETPGATNQPGGLFGKVQEFMNYVNSRVQGDPFYAVVSYRNFKKDAAQT